MIQVENISKMYARGSRSTVEALKAVTFDIPPGKSWLSAEPPVRESPLRYTSWVALTVQARELTG
jgi:hypothetical protein